MKINLSDFTRRSDLVLIFEGAAVIVLAAFLISGLHSISRINTQTAGYRQKLANMASAANNAQENDLNSRYLAMLVPVADSDDQEITFQLKKIESLARDTGISLDILKPGGVETADNATRYSVSIEFSAPLSDLVRFMYSLQSEPNWYAVAKMQILANSGQHNGLKINMLVTKTVFAAAPLRDYPPERMSGRTLP